jgi:hypothetical protein
MTPRTAPTRTGEAIAGLAVVFALPLRRLRQLAAIPEAT